MNRQNRNNGMYLGSSLFAFTIGFCGGAFVIDKKDAAKATAGVILIQGVLNRVMAGRNPYTRFAGSLGFFSGWMFQLYVLPDNANQPYEGDETTMGDAPDDLVKEKIQYLHNNSF
jgi:hypothetical protein